MSRDRPGGVAPPVRRVNTVVNDDGPHIAAVLRALERLRKVEAGPLADGLSAANARACLDLAVGLITAPGLMRELGTAAERPGAVAVVVARGVFTAPIEWAALFAAAGCRVHLKAPSAAPDLCEALARCLSQEGLPVSVGTDRDLEGSLGRAPDAVVAFGEDETVAEIRSAWPRARVAAHGHRFSLAVVTGDPDDATVAALARDVALYDTRGCMAPVALAVLGGGGDRWLEPLAAALTEAQRALPRGRVEPEVGPEWRRRLGLARVLGRTIEARHWAVGRLPVAHLVPSALPRMVLVHDADALGEVLEPHRAHLSSVAAGPGVHDPALDWFPRRCAPGALQAPEFPRLHDGVPMLASVCRRGFEPAPQPAASARAQK